jgi:hypothetical protein
MSFGYPISEEHVGYWGARAIYQGVRDDYHVDVLWNRQDAEGASDEFTYWLNYRALPWLRAEMRRACLDTDSDECLELREFKFLLRATPNKSYGYLYIGAAELKVEEVAPRSSETGFGEKERCWMVDGERFVFNADIPAIGSKVDTTLNKLGSGTVVGFHTANYGSNHKLVSLRVELDNPPKWWIKQNLDRAKAELIQNNLWMLKPKHERQLSASQSEGDQKALVRNMAGEAPSKLFNREGMQRWKEWKKNYQNPPAIIWDGDFTLIQGDENVEEEANA